MIHKPWHEAFSIGNTIVEWVPELPPELQRAEHIASRLHRQVEVAQRCGADRVSLNTDEAAELVQLLFDSLRDAKRLLHPDNPFKKESCHG